MLKDLIGLDETTLEVMEQQEEQMEFESNAGGCRMLEQIQGLSR